MSGGDFWSRRKARVREEEQADLRAAEQEDLRAREAALEEKSDAEILEELGLPDPDTLEPGADFRAFMANAVPDRIRRRALRRLWLSNPALANLDGLLDYGEDFTDGATVVENLQTAYQVGKGMLKHVEDLAREAANLDEPAGGEVQDLPEEEPAPLAAAPDEPDQAEDVAEPVTEASAPPPRRRMSFTFDDHAGGDA